MEVEARWTGFLGKIRTRFDEIRAETEQGCIALLAQCDDDPGPMTTAWTAMDQRMLGLQTKLSTTWEDKVGPLCEDAAQERRLERMGDELSAHMERQRERLRVDVYAQAARRIWARARQEQVGQIQCPQCGAPVEVPQTFQSINLPCSYCDGLVTFEPGGRIRAVQVHCVHPLAEDAAWSEWELRDDARQALNSARGEPAHLVKALELAEIAYWRAYLAARAQMVPALAEKLEADLEGKMRAFYLYR